MTAPAEGGYFAEVIEAMKIKGFTVFSQVAITNDDFRYHVPAKYARNTSLFFHYPSTTCIVLLEYTEHDYGDEGSTLRGHWHIHLNLKYKSDHFPPRYDEEDNLIKPLCKGFHHAGWSAHGTHSDTWNLDQSDSYQRDSALSPSDIAGAVEELLKDLMEHFAPTPFDELQVTSWTPAYSFPGCAPAFWDRFKESSDRLGKRRYLWSIVTRPWGSEGLKR